jgi:hypothetical protein
MFIIYASIILFLMGAYFYGKQSILDEGFSSASASGKPNKCPNILIEKNSKFYLYNSNEKKVPGLNPIIFENLEEYTQFLEWQRSKGIRCPVLYLQNGIDIQGNSVYNIRPSISEPQGGLPSMSPKYPPQHAIQQQSNDSTGQGQGQVSANPMDDNWGGSSYTQSQINKGVYKDNNVSIYVPS